MAENTTIYLVTDVRTVPYQGDYAAVCNTTQHRSRLAAEARYHEALASAARRTDAVSAGAYFMTNDGFYIDSQVFALEMQPEPEQTEGE